MGCVRSSLQLRLFSSRVCGLLIVWLLLCSTGSGPAVSAAVAPRLKAYSPRRLWLPGPGHRPRRLWLPGPGPAVSAAMAPRLRAQPLVAVGPRLRACSPRWLRLPGSGTAALGGCGSRLQRTGPGAVAHGLSCSAACGILPNQRSDLCLLC